MNDDIQKAIDEDKAEREPKRSMCDCNQGRLPCSCKPAPSAGDTAKRIRHLEEILEQHGTMTGDTNEREYEDLSEELEHLRGELPPAGGEVELFSMKYGEQPTEEDGKLIRHAEHVAIVTLLQAENKKLRGALKASCELSAEGLSNGRVLYAERDALKAEVERLTEDLRAVALARDVFDALASRWQGIAETEAQARLVDQSELTKARELLNKSLPALDLAATAFKSAKSVRLEIRKYLANQSAPAAKCETCGGTGRLREPGRDEGDCVPCDATGRKSVPVAKGDE